MKYLKIFENFDEGQYKEIYPYGSRRGVRTFYRMDFRFGSWVVTPPTSNSKFDKLSDVEISKILKYFSKEKLWSHNSKFLGNIDIFNHLKSTILEIRILKYEDEWFMVQEEITKTDVGPTRDDVENFRYYECDQFSGLEKLLIDKNYENF